MPALDARTGRRRLIAQLAIASGVILLAASFLIPERALSRATWDAEHARQYQQAAYKLHELRHEANDATEPEAAEKRALELAAAQKDYDAVKLELDAATAGPRRISNILRWMGITLAGFGVIAYIACSQTSER